MIEWFKGIEHWLMNDMTIANLGGILAGAYVSIKGFIPIVKLIFGKKKVENNDVNIVVSNNNDEIRNEIRDVLLEELQPLKDMLITAYTSAKSIPTEVKLELIKLGKNDKIKSVITQEVVNKVNEEVSANEEIIKNIEDDVVAKLQNALKG